MVSKKGSQAGSKFKSLIQVNATQLGVNDDKGLLELIQKAMSDGGREAHDRFIFIANKIDVLDSERESVSSVIDNVKKYLSDNGILNPLVIPVSAELAKLIRIKRNSGIDALSKKQKRLMNSLIDQFVEEEEMNLLEHVKYDIDRSIYKKINSQLKEAKSIEDDERIAEILSGIPIIEALLDNYLTKHAVPSRVKDAIDSFSKVVSEVEVRKKIGALLEKDESELNNILSNFEEFNNNKSRIEKAKEFKDKVRRIEYKISKEADARRREIDRKQNDLLDGFADEFSNNLEPTRAKGIMNRAERKVGSLIAETQELLSEDLEKDLFTRMEELRIDYQKYVSDLLSEFPKGEAMSLAKELQSTALEMPDAKELIEQATFEEVNREYLRTERHGFLWLKKRDVYRTTYEEKVDMSEVGEEFEQNLQKTIVKMIREFNEASESNFLKSKQKIISHMDKLDNKLESVITSLEEMSQNKNLKNKQIALNKEKIEWYENFSNKLQAVLDINVETVK
ncbi:MAG: hypothetical protein CMH98_04580 [Oceanospirillaceae bacterium]|nr:hypothetical protein [Oceanospirillaceae bacterium]